MKPIKLILKYIGPHKNSEIDFSALEDFFLISGETGAGKTFIFDSIIHSIYGEPKKELYDQRDKSLVSINKPDDEIPSIEFTFGIGKATYRVFRTLSYKKSTKKTKENPTAKLEILDEKSGNYKQIENDVASVNESLEKLIGLNRDEFTKIVILPQGEFQAFLKKTPTEKKDFLIKFFATTQIFENIKKNVSAKFKDEKSTIKSLNETLQKKCEETGFSFDSDNSKLEELKQEEQSLQEKQNNIIKEQIELTKNITTAKNLAEEARKYEENLKKEDELKKSEEKINGLRQKTKLADEALLLKPSYDEKQTAFNEKNKNIQMQAEIKEKISALDKAKTENESQNESISKKENEIKANEKQLQDIEKKLGKISILLEKEEECKNIQFNLDKSKKNLSDKLETEKSLLTEIHERSETEESVLPETIVLNLNNSINEKNNLITKLSQELKTARNNEIISKELKTISDNLEKASFEKQKYELLKNRYEKLKEQNFAYFLAKNLEDKTPCPVCGSLNHPSLAKQINMEDELKDELENSVNTELEEVLTNALNDANTKYDKALSSETYYKASINEKTELLNKNKLNQTAEEIENNLNNENNELSKLQETLVCIEKLRNEYETIVKARESLEKETSSLLSDFAIAQNKYEAIKKDYFDDEKIDADSLLYQKENLEKENAELSSFIDNWKQENLKITQENANLHGQEKLIEEALETWTQKSEQSEKKFIEVLKKSPFKTEEQIIEALDYVKTKGTFQNEISEWEKAIHEIEIFKKNAKTTISSSTADENLKKLQEEYNNSQNQLTEIKQELKNSSEALTKLQVTIDDIIKLKNEIDSRNENLKPLELLNMHLDGKPSIDSWATKLYFTNILDFANNRFKEITNNQYKFIIGGGKKEGVNAEDLDIFIIDYSTNMIRHCSSLSGGEEFLASISLALGLADAIQCQHSNTNIESMFIDEGFGTLGIDIQNKAVEVLRQLNVTRKIGIISHSENLEQEIKSHIKVEKKGDTATVKVFYGTSQLQ